MICQECGASLEGRPRQTRWCSETCRKRKYAGVCVDCGGPTDGSSSSAPHERCLRCSNVHRTRWTRESIAAAIRLWDERYGRPPAAPDWNMGLARKRGEVARLERFGTGEWPHLQTVQKVFGSWSAAIEAAGFVPLPPGRPRGRHALPV